MQLTRELSIKKTRNLICTLPKEQWMGISALMKAGYNFLESIQILQIPSKDIEEAFKEGKDLKEILLDGHKGRFYEHLSFFLEISDVANAIDSALTMEEFEKGWIRFLVSFCAYPCFIFLFAYVMMVVFSTSLLPQMIQGFELTESSGFLLFCVEALQYFCVFLAIGAVASVCFFLVLYLYKPLRLKVLIRLQNKISLLKDHTSYMFAGYMKVLEKQGVPTKKAMKYMMNVQKDSLFSLCINSCEEQLCNGIDFIDVLQKTEMLNELFHKMIPIGIITSSISELLEIFMQQQELIWKKKVKKIGIFIQLLSYSFVAILVLVVYQLMLLPLSMLEQF